MQRKDVEQMPGWWLVIGPDGEPDGAHCSVKPADEPYARKYISADAVETALRALLDRAERAEAERDAAFAAGQEEMRERAALEAERGLASAPNRDGEMMQAIAEGIRDIPIKPRP